MHQKREQMALASERDNGSGERDDVRWTAPAIPHPPDLLSIFLSIFVQTPCTKSKQQILSTYTSHPNPASNLEESQHGSPLLLPTSHLRILLQHFQHPPRLAHLSSRTLHPSSPTRHPRPVLRRRKRPQEPHPDRRRHLRWGRRRRCGRREWGCHG